jgi:hypothetical protein
VHQVADSAQRLGEVGVKKAQELGGVGAKKAHDLGEVSAKKARKANKKVRKSVRRHPAGWGAAVLGLVAGIILGIAARRRRS